MAKRSVNELLFMHYFRETVAGFWGLRPQTPTGAPSLEPAGGLSSPGP